MCASVRIIILALALVGAVPALVARTPPAPIVKVEGLRQIFPHVHIIPDNSVPLVPNVGYVVGDSAALVIDTGLGPRNGAAVYEVAKKLAGTKALYLVTTHFPAMAVDGEALGRETRYPMDTLEHARLSLAQVALDYMYDRIEQDEWHEIRQVLLKPNDARPDVFQNMVVDALRIEPVSSSKFPGKLTGNFIDSDPPTRFSRPIGKQIQWLAAKFPTQRNREFLEG